ncbi:MAG TPA: thiol reductant ABC exporter subunit CydD [Mycobacteriales bacterium]|nr:thiol reductant ABC exporter subunit CydD [Mycobacteriales bacterium]
MKPLDPRLLRRAAPARRYLGVVVASGCLTAGLVVAQATLLAGLIVHADRGVSRLRDELIALLAVLVARGVLAYAGEVGALRAAAAVRSTLRRDLAAKVLALGPAWTGRERSGEVTTLMTKGLDALDGYFARYLPQLVLATFVPAVVLARVAGADFISAVTIGSTIPLIPVFMILVGLHTRARTERQWRSLSRLGGHFLDVVEGLPTLKVFGRAKAQVELIRKVSDSYRRTTMATLRVAFISALVLELLATLATAVVAVEVGLRLLNGDLAYQTALLVLLLTPEAYLPLRAVGASFHASADGVAAVNDALDILEHPSNDLPSSARCDLRHDSIRLDGVTVRYDDRSDNALDSIRLAVDPGERVALSGPSGAGKSTVLAVLLGFVQPTGGDVSIGSRPYRDLDVERLRAQVAWVPQAPRIFAGTVADNIRLGQPDAEDAAVRAAAAAAGFAEVVAGLPAGYETVLGDRGLTLSTGQRQRLALARAFLRDAPLVLLDEPGAHLDPETATALRAAVERLASGRSLIVVTHDNRWHDLVDRVVILDHGRVAGDYATGARVPAVA